ncbi:MAG TPA: hypothetical protein ENG51_13690 [Deltaproteobacteria bacterium]|nr:hypothetical protein [Deltaproteobacteria bacterium]
MADPLSLVALGAAVGGAAGKFVEKAWDSGEKWIASYFANHHEKSQKKAKENTLSFLTELASRVEALEKNRVIPPERISAAQEHPEFSVVLQKAMISASQTTNKEKHQLLARLVAERMKASPESMLALTSKMACDAISYTTPDQLKILGLVTNIMYIGLASKLPKDKYLEYLQSRLSPFSSVRPTNLDYVHLEALSCLKFEPFLTRDLKKILTDKNQGEFDYDVFKELPIGKNLIEIWENYRLKSTQLTSVGQMIGVMVSDQITGSVTDMSSWE